MSVEFEMISYGVGELIPKLIELISNKSKRENFFKKLPKGKSTTRKDAINELALAHKKEKLVLVMGAGVSMDFGLPCWNTLLQKLMLFTIEKDPATSSVISKLFSELFSPNPLIAGRYLQQYYESKSIGFEEAVRAVLYQEIQDDKKTKLMDEIVKLCVSPGNNPNLNSIITYNFDDLLERHLEAVGMEVPYKPIYGVSIDHEEELPIYHVHGYLPREVNLTELNQITFGENIYHKQYIDIYSWNNIVQINKFRENTCLFIGTSLTDPNTRRLLDIAKQQRGEKDAFHYVIKKRYDIDDIVKKMKRALEDNPNILNEKNNAELALDETAKLLIKTIEKFEEADTFSLGVKTIWINDFKETYKVLEEFRKQ